MATTTKPSQIPKRVPQATTSTTRSTTAADPTANAANLPSKVPLRPAANRTPAAPATATASTPSSRPRAATHAVTSAAAAPTVSRPPTAASASRVRSNTTALPQRPTTAAGSSVPRPPTSSSSSRARSTTVSTSSTPSATARSRAPTAGATSTTAFIRKRSVASSPVTARCRGVSSSSSATASPVRSRATSSAAVTAKPSAPLSKAKPSDATATTRTASVAPAPEPISAAQSGAQPASTKDDNDTLHPPSALLAPPTDPTVPVYHAPHFSPDTHAAAALSASAGSTVRSHRPLSSAGAGHSRPASAVELEARVNEWRQAYLHLSIEEVADWLTRTNHGQPITAFIAADSQRDPLEKEKEERQHRHSLSLSGLPPPPPLFDCLQSGVLLCELANAIQPSLALPYKAKATVGSFLARDNVERFLRAAMDWGVPRSQLFEVDDLVMRKNDRGVVNALLDVSRIVYLKFGIAPPTIVEMELEIAQIEQQQQVAAPAPPPRPVPVPPPPPVAPEEVKPKGPRYLPYIADPDDPLDVAVGGLVNRYALDLLVKRTERGQYHIDEEKVQHLRLVRHLVLVRVGGGWEPFVSFCTRRLQEVQ